MCMQVLLVLFAEESLLHRRTHILGVSTEEIYDLLRCLVQSHAISQNDLMDAVASVDTEGSATISLHLPSPPFTSLHTSHHLP